MEIVRLSRVCTGRISGCDVGHRNGGAPPDVKSGVMELCSQAVRAVPRVPEKTDPRAVWDKLASLPSLDEEPLDAEWIPTRDPLPPREAGPPTAVLPPPPAKTRVGKPVAEPLPAPPVRKRRRRRWLRWVAFALLIVLLLLGLGAAYGWYLWGDVERVELGGVLAGAAAPGTNYLIVGTDSRAGIGADNPNAGAMLDPGLAGERTDTVVVLRRSSAGNKIMALPRDLWLPISPSGGEQRLNTAFASGPAALVETVQTSLGIPIDHYLEVDFAGFLSLIDAVGGITVDFANPAFDTRSGLSVDSTGPVHLDSHQALAYVRSRAYTEIIDGAQVTDPTADIGRVQRQQRFLESTFNELGSIRNPLTAFGVLDSMGGSLRIDDQMSFWHAMGFARSLPGLNPESVVLPTYGFTTAGGAAVLGFADGADAALDQFR